MRKRHMLVMALTALAAPLAATSAAAAQVEVRMLNHGPDGMMVFEPAFVMIKPGDTVKFIAADKGHNAASLPGMVPAGAAGFTGSINQEIEVRFTRPGLYGYHCIPHTGLGMVGLIEVGNASNKAAMTAAAGKLPGLARGRMATLLGRTK